MRPTPFLVSLPLATLLACSDYGLQKAIEDAAGVPPVEFTPDMFAPDPPARVPDVSLEPAFHDFGSLELGSTDSLELTLANFGSAPLHVSGLSYSGTSAELVLDATEALYGPFPWQLSPGEARVLEVAYVPVDTVADGGALRVRSDDPDEPVALAEQLGRARPFAGFSTGWYVYDDPTHVYTEDPAHVVDTVGDPDGYWYEPSGLHALMGSADPVADFATLRDWVIARAGAPYPYAGPFSLQTTSSVTRLEAATFAYVLCDFWLDSDENPAAYTLSVSDVDDGVRVLLNGELLGQIGYGMGGSWSLANATPGEVNTMILVLQDNAKVDKFVDDITFAKDGVPVP
jgi:hypothetical protein